MRAATAEVPLLETAGVIEQIDGLGRALTVVIDGRRRVFDLAPDCVLSLHGEPVKLRLLQAADRARLVYALERDGPVAYTVCVG